MGCFCSRCRTRVVPIVQPHSLNSIVPLSSPALSNAPIQPTLGPLIQSDPTSKVVSDTLITIGGTIQTIGNAVTLREKLNNNDEKLDSTTGIITPNQVDNSINVMGYELISESVASSLYAVLSTAAEASTIVSTVLKLINGIIGACREAKDKDNWMVDFENKMKLIETDLTSSANSFHGDYPAYLSMLKKFFLDFRKLFLKIGTRGFLTSLLFSNQDKSRLKQCAEEVNKIRQEALSAKMNDMQRTNIINHKDIIKRFEEQHTLENSNQTEIKTDLNEIKKLLTQKVPDPHIIAVDFPKPHVENEITLIEMQSSPYYDINICRGKPYRSSVYVERQDVHLEIMTRLLEQWSSTVNSIATVSLHGIGGLGKSSLASFFLQTGYLQLSNLYSKKGLGVRPIVIRLWFDAEHLETLILQMRVSIRYLISKKHEYSHVDTFTSNNIAYLEENLFSISGEQVKERFKQLLKLAACPWIIVFDNAKSYNSLQSFLPEEGLGFKIFTCRDKEQFPVIYSLPDFTLEATKQLLKKILQFPDREIDEYADVFVNQLELTLPLALIQAANYVRNQKCSATIYARKYHTEWKYVQLNKSISYPGSDAKSVLKTWKTTMDYVKTISPLALEILNCLAFIRADKFDCQLLLILLHRNFDTANAHEKSNQEIKPIIKTPETLIEEFKKNTKLLKEIVEALQILDRFAMITLFTNDTSISSNNLSQHNTESDNSSFAFLSGHVLCVHRLVQSANEYFMNQQNEISFYLTSVLDFVGIAVDTRGIILGPIADDYLQPVIIPYYERCLADRDIYQLTDYQIAALRQALGCCELDFDITKALQHFKEGMKVSPSFPLLCDYTIGIIRNGQMNEALDVMQEYHKLIPKDHPRQNNYFSEIESDSLPPPLKSLVKKRGCIDIIAEHLYYYLMCYIAKLLKLEELFQQNNSILMQLALSTSFDSDVLNELLLSLTLPD